MLYLLDRQLIGAFFKGFLICVVSLLSLYVVIDLFTNLDDFGKHGEGFDETLRLIFVYYSLKIPQIGDRLFEPILLLSAMFAVAMMQRNNEQLPLLSAGGSTRRIVRPILVSSMFMLSLLLYNQEKVIPTIGQRLMNQRDDPNGFKESFVRGSYEPNGIHIVGQSAFREDNAVVGFCCTIPVELSGTLMHLEAEVAHYVPPSEDKQRSGGWELNQARSLHGEIIIWDKKVLEPIDTGKYFLYTKRVDYRELTKHRKWYALVSTWQLYTELHESESERLPAKAVLFHSRFTRPLLAMLLVMLGLAVILRDQNKNVFINAALCLIVCSLFFIVGYACKLLGDNDYLPPVLAAWLPVLLFGPITLVTFDAVHT